MNPQGAGRLWILPRRSQLQAFRDIFQEYSNKQGQQPGEINQGAMSQHHIAKEGDASKKGGICYSQTRQPLWSKGPSCGEEDL
jgi:phosphoribosyl-AMP cyclohydrolase